MARGRRAAAYIAGGFMNRAKHNALPAGGGFVADMAIPYLAEHSDTVRDKYWGGPLALFAAAAFTNIIFKNHQKALSAGHAIAGAAGMLFGFNRRLKAFQDGVQGAKSPVMWFGEKPMAGAPAPASAPAPGANGPDDDRDAGMGYGGPDTGMRYGEN